MFRKIYFLLLSLSAPLCAEEIKPGEPFDYASMAFYPDRWKEQKLDAKMIPWEGKEVVVVTSETPLDGKVMGDFIKQLDGGWKLYREMVGETPRNFKVHKGKPTIVALPGDTLSCGYGCGMVGATGIEMTRFYTGHFPGVAKNPLDVPNVYYYEMGRNFFVFGDRHSCFTTGFAVFMRYVCSDTLKLHDGDKRTRGVIDSAIDLFEKNDMSFIDAMTEFGEHGEKGNRLKDEKGKPIGPSDQNVMYASLMLKLRKEYGGNAFVKEFYHELVDCPSVKAVDQKTATQQSIIWMVCASVAAGENLAPRFSKNWKLKLDEDMLKKCALVQWKTASAKRVASKLLGL